MWASVTRGGAGGADSTAASVRRQRRFADLASACSQVRFENTDRYLVMTEVRRTVWFDPGCHWSCCWRLSFGVVVVIVVICGGLLSMRVYPCGFSRRLLM